MTGTAFSITRGIQKSHDRAMSDGGERYGPEVDRTISQVRLSKRETNRQKPKGDSGTCRSSDIGGRNLAKEN
jgi:hypothetical protein